MRRTYEEALPPLESIDMSTSGVMGDGLDPASFWNEPDPSNGAELPNLYRESLMGSFAF